MRNPAVNLTIKLLFATLALTGVAFADIATCLEAYSGPVYEPGAKYVIFGELPVFQTGPETYACRVPGDAARTFDFVGFSIDFIDPATNLVSDYFDFAWDVMTLVSDSGTPLAPRTDSVPGDPPCTLECFPQQAMYEIGSEGYNYVEIIQSGPPFTIFHIVSDVPEPGSLALLGTVLAGLAVLRFATRVRLS